MQIIVHKLLVLSLAIIIAIGAIVPSVIDFMNTRQIAVLEAAKICYSQDLRANPNCAKWLRKIK